MINPLQKAIDALEAAKLVRGVVIDQWKEIKPEQQFHYGKTLKEISLIIQSLIEEHGAEAVLGFEQDDDSAIVGVRRPETDYEWAMINESRDREIARYRAHIKRYPLDG